MRIVSNELAFAKDRLQARILHCDCQCCGKNEWAINEIVVLHTDDLCNEIVGQLPSMVQVICRECAHVMLFDLNGVKRYRRQDAVDAVSSSLAVAR